VEGVEHQQRVLQTVGGGGADHGIIEHVDQRLDVVAAEHGAEQFDSLDARNQRARRLASADFCEKFGLDLGGLIDAGRHAVRQQIDEKIFFALGRRQQQCDQGFGLLLGQRQRRNAERGAFGDMGTVGFEHDDFLFNDDAVQDKCNGNLVR
jgi:hypothetical protein